MSENSIGFSINKENTIIISIEPTKFDKDVGGKNLILRAVIFKL